MKTIKLVNRNQVIKLTHSGRRGPAGTITVGSVTTGNPDQSVTITNVGTSTDAILNFVIPQGKQGVTGTSIIQSVQGRTGDVVITKEDLDIQNIDNTSDADKPVSTAQQTELDKKVDKVAGKALSTNDYTTTEKTKLANIETEATKNDSNAQLRDRTTHTGVQPISSVTDLQDTLDSKANTTYVDQKDALKLDIASVVNNLTSSAVNQPLSANQGRVIKASLDSIGALLASDDTSLDQLQEIIEYIKLNREDLENLSIPAISGLQDALDSKQPVGDYATAAQGAKADTAVQPSQIADFETSTELNARDAANRQRSNHSGTQAISTVVGLQSALDSKSSTNHTHTAANVTDFDTEVSNNTDVAANTAARHTHTNSAVLNATTASFTTADETKLDGIATGATANATDASLRARSSHTGTQAISTVTGLQSELDSKADTTHDHDSRYYTETEVDTKLALKADTTYVNTKVADLVNQAPATLDTLSELSDALGDDPNFATTVATQIGTKANASDLTAHTGNTSNPHSVTKAQVGLGNVDNTSDADKPISTAVATALTGKANTTHTHAQADVTGLSTSLSGKEATIAAGTTSQYYRGDKSWQTLNKAAVGLSNVDNTTDLSKPVSIATQDALNLKENNIAPGTTAQYWRGDKTWQQFPEFDPARVITQSSHGFSVGEVLRFNGTAYVLAKADSVDNAEVVGIVKEVVNANTFKLAVSGYVNGLSGLTTGVNFLSPATAGVLTTIEPNSSGQISKPILIADSATSGYFFNFRGFIIGSGGTVGITEEDATALAIAL